MTNTQIKKLNELHAKGMSSTAIANALRISPGTVRAYISRHPPEKSDNPVCKFCGRPLTVTQGKRIKIFCSSSCKTNWHNERRDPKETKVCKSCGKEFKSYGNKAYCSRECYRLFISKSE